MNSRASTNLAGECSNANGFAHLETRPSPLSLSSHPAGNRALARAWACLAHPTTVAAAALLLLNALWLQPHQASWLTGKIGDAAWLFLAPFVLAIPLAWLVPARCARQAQVVGSAAILFSGAFFVLVKTSPAANLAVAQLYLGLAGRPAKLALDAGDLLALPALAGAWRMWRRPLANAPSSTEHHAVTTRGKRRATRLTLAGGAGLVCAVLALVADAPDPRGFFVTCLAQQGPDLYGFSFYKPYLGSDQWTAYRSDDGGLHWRYYLGFDDRTDSTPALPSISAAEAATPGITATVQARAAARQGDRPALARQAAACRKQDKDWTYSLPDNPQVRYRFTQGQAIARSDDGGQTWQDEHSLAAETKVIDALYQAGAGNLLVVLSGSVNDVVVRTPDANWHSVEYSRYD